MLCGKPTVTVGVFGDLLNGLARVLGDKFRHFALGVDELLGLDGDVCGGATDTCGGLVHHDAGVRQCVALALGAGGQQELAHGGCQTHAIGCDIAGRVHHGVVNRHACGDGASGAVDVQADVARGIFSTEQQDLSAQFVGDLVVNVGTEEDNAFFQQTLVDRVAEVHAIRH